MKNYTTFFLGLFLILASLNSIAGWYIIEEETLANGTKSTRHIYIEGLLFKHTEKHFDFIYNQEEGLFTYVNNQSKTYWSGSLETYKKEYAEAKKIMEEKMLNSLPPEQRESYKKLMDEQMEAKNNAQSPEITVVNTNIVENIIGFKSEKYNIIVNDAIKEELWISGDADFYGSLDFIKFSKEMSEISKLGNENYTTSDKYISLFKNSFPMRKHVFTENNNQSQIGNKSVTEVKFAEEKQIPNSEFAIPSGYREVSLIDLLTQN